METTTIQVKKSTRKKLISLRIYKKEALGEVIERLTEMAVDEEPLSKEEIAGIRRSLKDLEAGRVYKMKDVAKKLSLR